MLDAPMPPIVGTAPSRTADWLVNDYCDLVWVTRDTNGSEPRPTAEIDFRFRLADGSLLTERPNLLRTAREVLFWVRDLRVSGIGDAGSHKMVSACLFHVLHAMTLLGIWSVSDITPVDAQTIAERCRYGAVALADAPTRIAKYFADLSGLRESHPTRFEQSVRALRKGHRLSVEAVLAACHVPDELRRSHAVAKAIKAGATQAGLRDVCRSEGVRAPQLLTAPALGRYLQVITCLRIISEYSRCEALRFTPFSRPAYREASRAGRPTRTTPAAPPRLMLHLMGNAFRWVTEEAPFALALLAQPDSGAPLEAPWPRDPLISGRTAIRLLATACFILIIGFSARRRSEVGSLTADCMKGSDADGWWMRVHILKNLQRPEWIPVPRAVARAVEAMVAVSALARGGEPGARLFQFLSPTGRDQAVDLTPHDWLDRFAEHVRTPLYELQDGTQVRWHWTHRMFRRFFSVLYFYRYENASLEVLSHMLRHIDLGSTRGYVKNDPEVARLWATTEWQYMGDLARAIASGAPGIGGPMGSQLSRDAEDIKRRLQAKLHVVPAGRVSAALMTVMKTRGLVLTPQLPATCTCPRTAEGARAAACRTTDAVQAGAVGPDFAENGPSVCARCPWAIISPHHEAARASEISHLRSSIDSGARAGTVLGDLDVARLATFEQIDRSPRLALQGARNSLPGGRQP